MQSGPRESTRIWSLVQCWSTTLRERQHSELG